MNKEQIIEEIAKDIPSFIESYNKDPRKQHLYIEQRIEIATALFNAGYRKETNMKISKEKLLKALSNLFVWLADEEIFFKKNLELTNDEYEFIKKYNGAYQRMDYNFVTTFIFPLKVSTYDDIDEIYYLNNNTAVKYKKEIITKFNEYMENDDLIDYFSYENKDKLLFMEYNFLEIENKLYGTVNVIHNKTLTEKDIENLKNYIEGQNSDGIGEGFEQQAIKTENYEIFIHFWSRDKNYFVLTFEEFIEKLNKGEIK